jgi:hypothetical protein
MLWCRACRKSDEPRARYLETVRILLSVVTSAARAGSTTAAFHGRTFAVFANPEESTIAADCV